MADTEKSKALQKAVQDFKDAVKAARARYHERVREIIKESDEKKAKAIKDSL